MRCPLSPKGLRRYGDPGLCPGSAPLRTPPPRKDGGIVPVDFTQDFGKLVEWLVNFNQDGRLGKSLSNAQLASVGKLQADIALWPRSVCDKRLSQMILDDPCAGAALPWLSSGRAQNLFGNLSKQAAALMSSEAPSGDARGSSPVSDSCSNTTFWCIGRCQRSAPSVGIMCIGTVLNTAARSTDLPAGAAPRNEP